MPRRVTRRFLVKDIALQAGVGTATVDRVLNRRGGVRPQTADRVHHAIRELEAQAGQLALSGRKLIVDLVVEAPQTFLDALDMAATAELPLMQPAVFRIRRHMRTRFPVADLEQLLGRIARRGSHGVILMGPDAQGLRRAVDGLEDAGIPVITLASDLAGTRRRGYVGLDNARAGSTAAWFIRNWLPDTPAPRILVTIRNDRFRGEEEREAGFSAAMARHLPEARIDVLVEGVDGSGFEERIATTAGAGAPVSALYSVGGSNRRILAAIAGTGQPKPLVIGHDLDPDNLALLAEGQIEVLIYHDLREDIRNACRIVMAAQDSGRIPSPPDSATLRVMVPPMIAT